MDRKEMQEMMYEKTDVEFLEATRNRIHEIIVELESKLYSKKG